RTDELQVMKRSLDLIIEEGYISKPEPIEFPTANGQTAFALFYPPQNKDFTEPAGQLPPLIVISHGGPTSATTAALRLSTQYWNTRCFPHCAGDYRGRKG